MNSLIAVVVLLCSASAGAKFLEVWLKPSEKRRAHETVVKLWYGVGEPDPRIIVQAPVRVVIRALDALYGPRIRSWVAFRRASIITMILFACALAISLLRSGLPFSLAELPWRTFEGTYRAVQMVANSDALQKETKPEVKAMTAAVVRKIGQYKNTENQVAYSVLFFPAIALIAATLNFGSVAFARQALRDIAEARTLTTIFSPALGNIFVSSAIYILGVSLLCVVATPVSWFVVWALIVYGQNVSWLLALALSIPSALIALFFTATWIKTLAIVITLHGAAVIVISFAAVLIFPFRQAARWGLLEVLDRAVSSEKGPFMFFATCFALVAALAVQLAKLFGGILPL